MENIGREDLFKLLDELRSSGNAAEVLEKMLQCMIDRYYPEPEVDDCDRAACVEARRRAAGV